MIVVNDTWRIGADEHQWIVYRASGVAKKDQCGGKAGETIWKPKAYFKDPGDATLFVARGHLREATMQNLPEGTLEALGRGARVSRMPPSS